MVKIKERLATPIIEDIGTFLLGRLQPSYTNYYPGHQQKIGIEYFGPDKEPS